MAKVNRSDAGRPWVVGSMIWTVSHPRSLTMRVEVSRAPSHKKLAFSIQLPIRNPKNSKHIAALFADSRERRAQLFDYYGEPYGHAWPHVASSYGSFDLAGFPKAQPGAALPF